MLFRHRGSSRVAQAFTWDSRAAFLVGIYSGAVFPFIGRIARGDLHCTPLQLSLIAAAPFIGNLFSPLWARQMDGRSKLPFAVGSWIVARSLFFSMALVTRAWPFVCVVSLASIIMTIGTPAYATIMKEIYPDRLRGRLMGSIRIVMQSASFFTALIAGRLLDIVGYRLLFPLGAAAGVGAAWAFSRVPVPSTEEDLEESGSFGILDTFLILRDDPGYRWFALSIFIYGFGNLLAQPVYTLFQVDQLGITNSQVANMANIQSISAILAFRFWGRYVDRRGAVHTVMVSSLLVGGINLVYLLASRVWHLYFAAAMAGISFAGIELSYLNATITFAGGTRIAHYQSIHSALLGLRGATAPFLGIALMHAVGMPATFAVSLAMIVIGAGMQSFGLGAANRPRKDHLT